MSPVPVDPRIEAAAKAMWGNDATWGSAEATQKSFRLSLAFAAVEAIDALAAADAAIPPSDAANGRDLLRLALKRMVCDQCVWDIEHGRGLLSDEPIVCTHRTRAAVVSPPASDPDCPHASATGISQERGDEKVWRCDGCGWLYVSVRTDGALSRSVGVEERLRELRAVVSPPDVYEQVAWMLTRDDGVRVFRMCSSDNPLRPSSFGGGGEAVFRRVER